MALHSHPADFSTCEKPRESCQLSQGCRTESTADISPGLRTALDQAGYQDVKVSQDREKGVITLTGQVSADNDKFQAETIAESLYGTQVMANQIAVV